LTAVATSVGALRRFVAERFPPRATVPIAGLLYAAPASLVHPGPLDATVGAVATALGLLCLRIADDLEDLERDRVLHPGRGLVSGRIDPASLRDANLALGAMLIVLESSSFWRLVLCLGGLAFYRVWYSSWRPHVHVVARPFFSNLVFPAAVFHGAGPAGWRMAIPLALQAWLTAVAHEFAHNVRSAEEESPLGPGYARALGARGTAALSAALFAAAALAAGVLWVRLGQPRTFLLVLLAMIAGLAFFLARLACEPGPRQSRSLYRAGILLGLMPAAGLLLR
jgi:4-hydroxybenzoate polyprenyltransferase